MNPLFMLFSLAKSSQIYTRTYTQTRRKSHFLVRSFAFRSIDRKKTLFFATTTLEKHTKLHFPYRFPFGDVNNMIIKKLFETD